MQAPLGSYIRIASGHWVLPQQGSCNFSFCLLYEIACPFQLCSNKTISDVWHHVLMQNQFISCQRYLQSLILLKMRVTPILKHLLLLYLYSTLLYSGKTVIWNMKLKMNKINKIRYNMNMLGTPRVHSSRSRVPTARASACRNYFSTRLRNRSVS